MGSRLGFEFQYGHVLGTSGKAAGGYEKAAEHEALNIKH